MTTPSLVPLHGSARAELATATDEHPADPAERIELTVITRRAAALPRDAAGVPERISRAELRESYGSDPADHELVARVLAAVDPAIAVTERQPGSRQLRVTGPVGALSRAFGTELSIATSQGPHDRPVTHRYRSGPLQIPAELDGVVVAVLGLDDRPQAIPHFRFAASAAPRQVSYTPVQVADLYQFPAGTDGSGQTVAIIELGGGFSDTDLSTYFNALGITTPPTVTSVGVDGATNVADKDPQGADGEVLLDIEVVGSVAPGANIIVYFAPNTDQGFVDAVTQAVHALPTPVAVSISWGGPESSWTTQSMNALDQAIADGVALGVTVTTAAGDNGSGDGASDGKPHADFPSSSPHALSCGGTSLQADPATGVISAETVWNDGAAWAASGRRRRQCRLRAASLAGQCRGPRPAAHYGTGRGVPDVAGNADPDTGYQVLIDGKQSLIGGTSAVAPLWAALVARLAQSLDASLGLIQTALYAGVLPGTPAAGLRDITIGNNGAYHAGPGWDACTGLGVPEGATLLAGLSEPGSTVGPASPAG